MTGRAADTIIDAQIKAVREAHADALEFAARIAEGVVGSPYDSNTSREVARRIRARISPLPERTEK